MANVIHERDRYIIFGVSDDLEIVGLSKDNKRYTQADIIDCLRNLHFAENKIPVIQLSYLSEGGKELATLCISNVSDKPYYLTQDYQCGKKTIRAGVIYSRTGDSNTPVNRCAPPGDVVAMWRERFGLDLPPLERFLPILEDAVNWEYDGVNKGYYKPDPAYSIETESIKEGGTGNYWWQNIEYQKPVRDEYKLKYNNQILITVPVISFRDEGLTFPLPDIDTLSYPKSGKKYETDFYADIFSFMKGTLSYSLFYHIRGLHTMPGHDIDLKMPLHTQTKPPIIKLPFLIFNTKQEKVKILKTMIQDLPVFDKTCGSQYDPNHDDVQKRMEVDKKFSWWAFNNFFI
ncbi:hypothetical protein EDC52_11912 [Biostraticola tofi]|uniref:Schlafen AlbA-2 domain-containing protein n=2 Tax=Biostraticola tofi TaxID=466109 RepID=A0A4R3YG72_9GAMM|nr:hypothetical protein EDC52_11912 [Biostraticola tofi]